MTIMSGRVPEEAVQEVVRNGGTIDLCQARAKRSSGSGNGTAHASPYKCAAQATLISEISEHQSRDGPDRDLATGYAEFNARHVGMCMRNANHEHDEESTEREGKKLVKSLCSPLRRGSTPNFSTTRRLNDIFFDGNSKVGSGLAGSHQDLGQRVSEVRRDNTAPLSKRVLLPHELETGICKNTHCNTVQTKLVGCPRISVEKSLGAVDNAGAGPDALEDKPARSIDDLDFATTAKITGARQRKISIPLLKPPSLSLEPPNARGRSVSPARRKFSNVSDAVSRKISTTIGWRIRGTAEVVPQAKYLCSQYIRCRLRRAGLLHKKLGLQRIRSVVNLHWGVEACEVFPRLLCLGQELERSHPQLYSSVVRQLSISLKSDKVVRHVVVAISSHLLRTDITWAKIISLYAISATLAADCVKQGHPEFVSSVVEGVGLAIEQHSGPWIVSQGGWSGVLVWSQPPAFELTPLQMLMLIGAAGASIAALIAGMISLLGHLMS